MNEHDLVDKTLFVEVNGHDEGACTSTIYLATQDFIARLDGSILDATVVGVRIKSEPSGPRTKILGKVICRIAGDGSVIRNDGGPE